MKEAYFKYTFQKKIRKENKAKTKTKCTNKRNTLVLRTFKYENKDNRNWRKPIIYSEVQSYNLRKSTSSASR